MIYLDGQYVPLTEASLPIGKNPVLLGVGIYETLRVIDGSPVALTAHMERLRKGLEWARTAFPSEFEQAGTLIQELLERNKLLHGIARVRIVAQLTGDKSARPKHIIATAEPVDQAAIDHLRSRGRTAVFAADLRGAGNTIFNNKTVNIMSTLYALAAAKDSHAEEVIFCNTREEVCEASYGNLFVVQGNQLLTPPVDSPCLPGVTRDQLLAFATGIGLESVVTPIPRNTLFNADEIFTSGSVTQLMPIVRLENQQVGSGVPGRFCLALQAKLRESDLSSIHD